MKKILTHQFFVLNDQHWRVTDYSAINVTGYNRFEEIDIGPLTSHLLPILLWYKNGTRLMHWKTGLQVHIHPDNPKRLVLDDMTDSEAAIERHTENSLSNLTFKTKGLHMSSDSNGTIELRPLSKDGLKQDLFNKAWLKGVTQRCNFILPLEKYVFMKSSCRLLSLSDNNTITMAEYGEYSLQQQLWYWNKRRLISYHTGQALTIKKQTGMISMEERKAYNRCENITLDEQKCERQYTQDSKGPFKIHNNTSNRERGQNIWHSLCGLFRLVFPILETDVIIRRWPWIPHLTLPSLYHPSQVDRIPKGNNQIIYFDQMQQVQTTTSAQDLRGGILDLQSKTSETSINTQPCSSQPNIDQWHGTRYNDAIKNPGRIVNLVLIRSELGKCQYLTGFTEVQPLLMRPLVKELLENQLWSWQGRSLYHVQSGQSISLHSMDDSLVLGNTIQPAFLVIPCSNLEHVH